MAVKLRLRRLGKKKQPIYKVVAADARSPRDGRFIEAIGLYNPLTDPATIDIKEERALYWLGVGAQPTDTVKSLLRKRGILLIFNLIKKGMPEEKIEAKMLEWQKLQEANEAAKAKKAAKEKAEEPVVEEKVEEKTESVENIQEAQDAASEGTQE